MIWGVLFLWIFNGIKRRNKKQSKHTFLPVVSFIFQNRIHPLEAVICNSGKFSVIGPVEPGLDIFLFFLPYQTVQALEVEPLFAEMIRKLDRALYPDDTGHLLIKRRQVLNSYVADPVVTHNMTSNPRIVIPFMNLIYASLGTPCPQQALSTPGSSPIHGSASPEFELSNILPHFLQGLTSCPNPARSPESSYTHAPSIHIVGCPLK